MFYGEVDPATVGNLRRSSSFLEFLFLFLFFLFCWDEQRSESHPFRNASHLRIKIHPRIHNKTKKKMNPHLLLSTPPGRSDVHATTNGLHPFLPPFFSPSIDAVEISSHAVHHTHRASPRPSSPIDPNKTQEWSKHPSTTPSRTTFF